MRYLEHFVFGRNVYLPSLKDKDFVYFIISVNVRNVYYSECDDKGMAYFCCQRHGVAMPLHPGDVLIINPLRPHSVPSRCYESDDVFCFGAYLKYAIVGHKLELSTEKKELAEEYYKCIK